MSVTFTGVSAMTATRSRVGFADKSSDLAGLLGWFARMREGDPVSWDEHYGAYHVFRYADIEKVLADPAAFSSDLTGLVPPQEEIELFSRGNFVRMDPPQHTKMRRIVSKAFTRGWSPGWPRASRRSPTNCSTGGRARARRPGAGAGIPAAGDGDRRAHRGARRRPATSSGAGPTSCSARSCRTP